MDEDGQVAAEVTEPDRQNLSLLLLDILGRAAEESDVCFLSGSDTERLLLPPPNVRQQV